MWLLKQFVNADSSIFVFITIDPAKKLIGCLRRIPRICMYAENYFTAFVCLAPYLVFVSILKNFAYRSWIIEYGLVIVPAVIIPLSSAKASLKGVRLIYEYVIFGVIKSMFFASLGVLSCYYIFQQIQPNSLLKVLLFTLIVLCALAGSLIMSSCFLLLGPEDRFSWVQRRFVKIVDSRVRLRSEILYASYMIESLYAYLLDHYRYLGRLEKLRELKAIPKAGKAVHLRIDEDAFFERLRSRFSSIQRVLDHQQTL